MVGLWDRRARRYGLSHSRSGIPVIAHFVSRVGRMQCGYRVERDVERYAKYGGMPTGFYHSLASSENRWQGNHQGLLVRWRFAATQTRRVGTRGALWELGWGCIADRYERKDADRLLRSQPQVVTHASDERNRITCSLSASCYRGSLPAMGQRMQSWL